MEQHVFRDRGAPDFIPTALAQHYTDMDTGERYLSAGTSTVADWGTPIVTKEDLEKRILQYSGQQGTGGGVANVAVKDVVNVGQRAVVSPSANAGKMVLITDGTGKNTDYLIDLTATAALEIGAEIRVFNNTTVNAQVLATTDLITYAFNAASAKIRPKGVAVAKYIGNQAGKNKWLIYGDLVGV